MSIDRSGIASVMALAAVCATPLAAQAQSPSYAARGETISGTIASVQSVNHIFVADDRGFTDDVTLRPGAVVFSGGVRLEPGVRVTIAGAAAGPTFLAARVSASADSVAASTAYPVPVPVYYPEPAYYPAPVYYGYGYGYGFGFGFGAFYRGWGVFRGYGSFGGYGGFHGGGSFGGHGHFR
jgi:hypothetical protein